MDRTNTQRGLKIGLLSLVGLALLAAGANVLKRQLTPVQQLSGYTDYVITAASVNTGSTAFVLLKEELRHAGFELKVHTLAPDDLQFEFEIESALGVDRLECLAINHNSLKGYLLHWTPLFALDSQPPEDVSDAATIRHVLSGVDSGGIAYKDVQTFERILDEVLETYNSQD